MNQTKTLVLMATLTALFVWAGHALGGSGGLALAVVLAAVMNLGAYWFSDRIVLAMHKAQEIRENDARGLYGMLHALAARANMPMPRLYLIPDQSPNAFATGRNPGHAVVAVTEGLLKSLSRDELEGVIAHELAHIRNRDTLIMAVAATIAGALSTLANMAMWGAMLGGRDSEGEEGGGVFSGLLGVLVAPFAAMLIQMAISRSREFIADEYAGRLTMQPLALASALRRIEGIARRVPPAEASPATAHLYIVNPFMGGGLVKLFSTHPSTDARVERLEALHRGGALHM